MIGIEKLSQGKYCGGIFYDSLFLRHMPYPSVRLRNSQSKFKLCESLKNTVAPYALRQQFTDDPTLNFKNKEPWNSQI